MPGRDAKGPWDPEGVCLAAQVPCASLLCPQVPVQPPGAAEGMGAEHRPGRLRAQAAHSHLLRALPARVLQRLWEPQEPQAQCSAYSVRLPGPPTDLLCPPWGLSTGALRLLQLVRENMDPTGRSGDATSGERKVLPEPASRECGLGRKMDTEAEALQPPPEVGGPGAQVPPHTPEASGVPGQPASPPELKRRLPTQPSDHSYALLDLDALKKKLFLTLKENEKLRRRLKAQRLVMRRMCSQLRARLAGRPGLQARPPLGQQS
ncbi:THAP domain-containing protein 3 isoform X1 [Capricornis sumatraensis]|uniref:THAP domain-containing protein 3 isoform X1 n=1 Tax=Capricornis sumatraensis TaxID=34865 RepID=UPI0036053AA0